MDLGLDGRHVVVSGGSTGLGLATARVLVAEGAHVTIAARHRDGLDAASATLGENAATVSVDLTDDGAPRRLIEEATEAWGAIDGLFVSHGGPPPGDAAALDDEAIDRALALSLRAPVRLVRDVAATMDGGGAIVVLTSMSSVMPIGGLATSNITRPGVWAYVKTLADELGPRGVRVNALLPGRYDTQRLRELEDDVASRTGRTRDDVRADAEQAIPLRRLGDPDELGRVAAFLLSDAASYVTGAAWLADGGAVRGL